MGIQEDVPNSVWFIQEGFPEKYGLKLRNKVAFINLGTVDIWGSNSLLWGPSCTLWDV